MDFLGLIGLGIVAFALTNIDDFFVLMMFFSEYNFTGRQVVLGQYLGIGLLVAISALAAVIALVVPSSILGLMGFVPIALGIKKLVDLRKQSESDDRDAVSKQRLQNRTSLHFLAVGAVTFSNGADNIGVYVPLFANSTLGQTTTLIVVFMVMVALWCAIGYYLVNHSFVAGYIRRVGHVVLPFALIGLGMYILAEAFFDG